MEENKYSMIDQVLNIINKMLDVQGLERAKLGLKGASLLADLYKRLQEEDKAHEAELMELLTPAKPEDEVPDQENE